MRKSLVFILTMFSLSAGAGTLPDSVKEPIGQIIQLTGKKDYSGALNLIQTFTRKEDLSEPAAAIFRQLEANQYMNLAQWENAESSVLKLITEHKDLYLNAGLFNFGQMPAASALVTKLYESSHYHRAVKFADRALNAQPAWREINHHALASFWTALGDSHLELGELTSAIAAWERARQCWQSKIDVWKQVEPENFDRYQGLDRFNPLQIKVEAFLAVAYMKTGQRVQAEGILADWKKQAGILEISAKNELEGPRVFRKSVERAWRSAADRIHAGCSDLLKPTPTFTW